MTDEVKKAADDFVAAVRGRNAEDDRLYRARQLGTHSSRDVLSAFLAGHAHALRWVPVSESLPPLKEQVLVLADDGDIHVVERIEWYDGKPWVWMADEYGIDPERVFFWLAIPPAPKEQP